MMRCINGLLLNVFLRLFLSNFSFQWLLTCTVRLQRNFARCGFVPSLQKIFESLVLFDWDSLLRNWNMPISIFTMDSHKLLFHIDLRSFHIFFINLILLGVQLGLSFYQGFCANLSILLNILLAMLLILLRSRMPGLKFDRVPVSKPVCDFVKASVPLRSIHWSFPGHL